MFDILTLQKEFISAHLRPGDTAVDFTAGKGGDSCFLASSVGDSGHVFAFDIQSAAINAAKDRALSAGLSERIDFILDSHSNAGKYVKCPIKAGMFNLGWLPGSDHVITTLRETTMPAVEFAVSALDTDGVLTVAVYPGHPEGAAEGEMLSSYFETLDKKVYSAAVIRIVNSPSSPFFFVIEKGKNVK